MNKERINNLVVRAAPKWGGGDLRPPRGESLFSNGFSNTYLCARKHSGKTSNIFFILKRIMGKNTKLIIYCSTADVDKSWIHIIKYFKEKGNDVEVHTSLKDKGVDLLKEQVHELAELQKRENEEEDEEIEAEAVPPKEILKQKGMGVMNAILAHNLPPEMTGAGEEKKKPRKSKFNERRYIWVLDDLSTELKNKSLVGLLKISRHFGCCFLSSQYYLDIDPGSRSQIDYALIYGGQRDDKLELMYKDFDLDIDYTKSKELYEDATEDKYNSLYVDVRNSQFRHNFNVKYNLK